MEQHDRDEMVWIALFGNKETGDKGMVEKVDGMYTVFSSLLWFGNIIMWIAIVIGGLTGALQVMGSGIKHFVTGK